MPTILLVRHGQASFGADDYDQLSRTGQAQAAIVADALTHRGGEITRVLSGDLRRQRDTAAAMAERLGIAVDVDPGWDEYDMSGVIAAHPVSERTVHQAGQPLTSRQFQDILEDALAGWIAAGENSDAPESWPRFQARVTAALHELAHSLGPGETGVAYSSGGVIATVVATLLGLDSHGLLALNRVSINTGITKFSAGRRGLSLIAFNDHAHLETGDPELITFR